MKALMGAIVVLFILVFMGWGNAAPYLACDLPDPADQVTGSDVEITKVSDGSVQVVPGLSTVRGSDYLLADLSTYPPEKHRFRARFKNATAWPSEWSPFLDAGPPGVVKGSRIVP